jgi:CrcB protein
MGAFTTFSTYTFETADFLRGSQWLLAAGNFIGQNALGLACVFLGLMAGRWF